MKMNEEIIVTFKKDDVLCDNGHKCVIINYLNTGWGSCPICLPEEFSLKTITREIEFELNVIHQKLKNYESVTYEYDGYKITRLLKIRRGVK